MTSRTHLVLGGTGVTGRETVAALMRRGLRVASVGRRPTTTDGAESRTADLLDPAAATRALEGADVAYLTVALPYRSKVWQEQWPVLARNVVDAAATHGTHLVHLDNVYAFGPVEGPMTEETPLAPTSRKGVARAAVLRVLDDARDRGLTVTVGRSGDFYGPGATTGAVSGFVFERVARGKTPTWLLDADQPHSLTYTPDVGEGLAILGTDPAAAGRTWHLPTAPALTGREYVALAAGPGAVPTVMSHATLRIGALFSAAARETVELAYQWDRPSVLDSRAFEAAFGVAPTPVAEGIAATLAALRS